MAKRLSETEGKQILGLAGDNTHTGQIRADEFLPELRGKRAIRKFREMRDNDATIGASLYTFEQLLRDVELKVKPADNSRKAKKWAKFVEEVFDDMDHSLDDHVAEALNYLTYGFSWFEVVYKRRGGPKFNDPKKKSKYSDGLIGVRKIASRAPWTISQFHVDKKTGDILGIWQDSSIGFNKHYIPTRKSLYYRTTSINNDPAGRSVLRNAYVPYKFLSDLQKYEAIAIEREMHGIPVGRLPAEYLSLDATSDQVSIREEFKRILRDLKLNEQGYALLPSDLYLDADGNPTGGVGTRLVDIELISSNGTRNIDIDPIIRRYQHDIARSVLTEFMFLGASTGGSYALSKSKTNTFLRSLETYIQVIVDVLNKQLIETLWELNGLDYKYMPKIEAGDVAPHDLREIATFLRNLNGANIDVSNHPEVIQALMDIAEIEYNPEVIEAQVVEEEDE